MWIHTGEYGVEVGGTLSRTRGAGVTAPLAFCLLLLMLFGSRAEAVSYYVDAINGSDASSGISPVLAWKSLAQANKALLNPGDSLLFKSGGVWIGQLDLSASGTQAAPITVTRYGAGDLPAFENPDNDSASALNVSGDWNVVSNLLVRKVLEVGIYVGPGADHNVFRGIEATDCGLGIYIAGQYTLVTQAISTI